MKQQTKAIGPRDPALRAAARNYVRMGASAYRTKVIRADKAILCCEIERARTLNNINALVQELLGTIETAPPAGTMLALATPTTTNPNWRIITIAETSAEAALTLGLIVLASTAAIVRMAQAAAKYDIIGIIGTIIGRLTEDDLHNGCEDCVASRVLGQSRPQVRETKKVRTRRP